MGQKFKGFTKFEFQQRFTDESACMKYLTELKWSRGVECPQCKYTKYYKGHKDYIRQCTRCNIPKKILLLKRLIQ